LGLSSRITEVLDSAWMLPAVGQGALGVECRYSDRSTLELLGRIDHGPTRSAVESERAFLRALGGGCAMPIGGLGICDGETVTLRGVVLTPEGDWRVEGTLSGPVINAETVGVRLAEELLSKGAGEKLQR